MKIKRISAWCTGALCAIGVFLGLALLPQVMPVTVTTAVIVICLSICLGLLIPNLVSFWGLIAGICMLILPARVVGILLICVGTAGAVVNACVFSRRCR